MSSNMIPSFVRYSITVFLLGIQCMALFAVRAEENQLTGIWRSDALKSVLVLDSALKYTLTIEKLGKVTVVYGLWRAKEKYLYLEAMEIETAGNRHEYYKTLVFEMELSGGNKLLLRNRYTGEEIIFIR